MSNYKIDTLRAKMDDGTEVCLYPRTYTTAVTDETGNTITDIIDDQVNTLVGTLSNLSTEEKGTLVGAINEVEGEVGTLTTKVNNNTTAIAANTEQIGTINSNFNDTILKNVGEYVTASMTIKNNKVALCIWAKNTYGQNIIGIYDAFSGTFVPLINPANQTVEITGNGDGTITLSASNANYSTKFAMYLS